MSAYLGPVTERYVEGLDASLQKQGCRAPLLVTRSDGGLMGAGVAVRAPVATLMSGPAAAVQGAARLGQVAGHPNLITLDIGGTSCDVSFVTDGEPALSHEASVAGLPLLGSIVDVHSIGAGGGHDRLGGRCGPVEGRSDKRWCESRSCLLRPRRVASRR